MMVSLDTTVPAKAHTIPGADDETIRNVRTDGRVALQFEVVPSSTPTAGVHGGVSGQLVTIQGLGLSFVSTPSPISLY
jgi:hypothetical protein